MMTASPGMTSGYRGSVAATRKAGRPPIVSRVAVCLPSRGDPTAATTRCHGPLPSGGTSSAGGPAGTSVSLRAIAPAPRMMGNIAPTPRVGRASAANSTAARASAIAAPRWPGATSPAATAATIAPTARRLLRPISGDRDEVLERRERLLTDQLARPQVLDRGERLLLARSQDRRRGHRPDPR